MLNERERDQVREAYITGEPTTVIAVIESIIAARLEARGPDREALAKAWEQGYASGKSNAMRYMSDEPDAPLTPNPYRRDTEGGNNDV